MYIRNPRRIGRIQVTCPDCANTAAMLTIYPLRSVATSFGLQCETCPWWGYLGVESRPSVLAEFGMEPWGTDDAKYAKPPVPYTGTAAALNPEDAAERLNAVAYQRLRTETMRGWKQRILHPFNR